MPKRDRAPKKTASRSSKRTKRRRKTVHWTHGLFRTRWPRELTLSQRRRLRERNKFRRDIAEGRAFLDIEGYVRPDKSVQHGVWHVPVCWLNCEAWIFVSGSWIKVPFGSIFGPFFHDFGVEHMPKKVFNTLFSFLPPLPEGAFESDNEKGRQDDER